MKTGVGAGKRNRLKNRRDGDLFKKGWPGRILPLSAALDQALYEAAVRGELFPEDENGHPLGLEGGLAEGARIYTRGGGGGRTGTSG